MKKYYLTICSYLSLMAYSVSTTLLGPIVYNIKSTFNVTYGDVGLLMTALSIGFIITVFGAGFFSHKVSLKKLHLMGLLLLLGGLILFFFSDNFIMALTSYMLIGLGGGLLQISVNTIISLLYPVKRASSLNLLHIFFGIGALSGPFISSSVLQLGFPFYSGYGIVAVVTLVVFVLVAGSAFPEQMDQAESSLGNYMEVLRNGYIVLLILGIFLFVGVEMGINIWSVRYMEETLNMDNFDASLILSSFWFFVTFGRLICAFLAKYIKADILLAALCFLALITYCLYFISENHIIAAIMLSCTGLSFSGIFPVIIGLGGDRFPDRLSSVTSILMTSLGAGLMVFAWAMGVIGDHLSLRAGMGFLISALVTLFVVSVLLLGVRARRESEKR